MLAIYALMIVNVMGGLLDLGRRFLESFCRERPPVKEKESEEETKKKK